jgi:actin-related protein
MTQTNGASTPVLILDNGAYSIKAGISGVDLDPRYVVAETSSELPIFV